ncbi:LacI family DNA-binding transcriptional regulator [Quadrisphaera setariae]|uniref:LacI family transcriptional regulator n=1 Tax=Quadrisphaera setariae TaxID=2593304 RepID=A0A5C8Z235_9ACTN|nr:LacI family transcriptional regulator [Quadrisphaera setariae]
MTEVFAPTSAGRTATLRDVARLAGVSTATASKAINGRPDVKAATRERVLEAARQLAFSPNAVARSLSAGRTGTVGLLTSDLEGRFSLPVLMGAEDALGVHETSVFLCDARGDAIREQHHIRALLSRQVDGLIVVGARPDSRPSLGQHLPVPVVYAYSPSEDPQDLSLVVDNEAGGRLAVDHLITSGRTRIAHITGDPGYGASHDRVRGARERLAEAGLGLAGDQVWFGSWTEGWGRGATRMLLERNPGVDAIFAGSDQIARGVLDVLHEKGLRVPEDVAVIGFDNWEAMAGESRPALTTVDMQLEVLGRRAAEHLSAAIAGRSRKGTVELPCRLVQRSSTAPVL